MRVALAGNPNAGKSTLFNELTGATQKVGNYPGVTVERKEGACKFRKGWEFIDLPGTYSLSSVERSEDEKIARDVILSSDTDGVFVVLDASNLDRQLYLATQVFDLRRPTAIVLTNMDIFRLSGQNVNIERLEERLGIPVYAMVARLTKDVKQFAASLKNDGLVVPTHRQWTYPEAIQTALQSLSSQCGLDETRVIRFLTGQRDLLDQETAGRVDQLIQTEYQDRLCDFKKQDVLARYRWIKEVLAEVLTKSESTPAATPKRKSINLDRLFLSKIWAPIVFIAIMSGIFFSVFSLAEPAVGWIEGLIASISEWASGLIDQPQLRSLVVDGIITGVGNVIVFLPQIVILFFLLSLLEESGYLARAVFLVDLFFGRAGLSGRSFVPLLSSYACAVPGVMATRTIADPKERLATILVAPLMTCSARLPVYTLVVSAFIPAIPVVWGLDLRMVTFLGLYFGAALMAFVIAFIFRRTLLKGPTSELFVELPRYRLPHWRNVFTSVFNQARVFVRKAGTVILVFSVFMWALASFPEHPNSEATGQERLEYSLMGRAGKAVEPFFQLFGFDWKIGVSLGASFVAREVAVSTLATLYSLEAEDEDAQMESLSTTLQNDPQWNVWTAMSFLAFFFFSMQCMSTLAVVKKETGGWRWPTFMFVYLTALALIVSWGIHSVGQWVT